MSDEGPLAKPWKFTEECCVPLCPEEACLRVHGYQSGPERPDCCDTYQLCQQHYREYRGEKLKLVNIGWLEQVGVRMRPIRYCQTPECGNTAYNDEEQTALCYPCFMEAVATGRMPARRPAWSSCPASRRLQGPQQELPVEPEGRQRKRDTQDE